MVIALGTEPQVLEHGSAFCVVPTLATNPQATKSVDLFLAFHASRYFGEFGSRSTFALEMAIFRMRVDGLRAAEVHRKGKVETVVNQRHRVGRIDIRMFKAPPVNVDTVARNHRAGLLTVVCRGF